MKQQFAPNIFRLGRHFISYARIGISAILLGLPIWATGAELLEVEREVQRNLPGVKVEVVAPSPIGGVFEAIVSDQSVYVTEDGKYLFNGSIVNLRTGVDLSKLRRSQLNLKLIDQMPETKMIIYEPEVKPRHTVTVFTDIDCPYCRKLHREMGQYSKLGVRVRYLLFPRTGVGASSYQKAVSVWCADDQQAEMTSAKSGVVPPKRECDHPIKEHMALANRLGLRGTPLIIADTGANKWLHAR